MAFLRQTSSATHCIVVPPPRTGCFAVACADYDGCHPNPGEMDRIHPYRPRISRETRLLLTTALIAIVALWVLARARFPDRPASQNPVQPLLTQLTPRPTFADLAAEIAALRPRLERLLVAADGFPGLRVRDDVALVWIDPQRMARDIDSLFRHDRASGLSLLRT